MFKRDKYDAIVVGSGPNGLAAAITIARTGRSVAVVEAKSTPGGGMRTQEVTLPGFLHDICSAIHPLALGSPFFQNLPLAQYGLKWIHSPLPLVHPLDNGGAAFLERSLEATAELFFGKDAHTYTRVMQPLVRDWDNLKTALLGPLRLPDHPLALARFGLKALQPAKWWAARTFQTEAARALFAGMSGHSILPLERPASAAFGLVLATLGHAVGWPLPQGGSQQLASALVAHLKALGGELVTNFEVKTLDDLPSFRAVLLDVTPRQMLKIAGERFPARYQRAITRYRYGPGIFKLDYALSGPVPWLNEACYRAATVHLGGTLAEISQAERLVWQGEHPTKPLVLVVQPSLFDQTRAPVGKHTLWAYCHVPNGSTFDMTSRIEAQLERFAPGFKQLVLAQHSMNCADAESYNPNYIGGDINGGVQDLGQLFTRPTIRLVPYATPVPDIFICSASTPPGGGVHGMGGYYAAQAAIKTILR
jgi:phytoene dehydrogenase-like protein